MHIRSVQFTVPSNYYTSMSSQLTADFDVDKVLAEMSMQNKIKLLCGKDWWHTEDIPEHGIPSMRLSDGMWRVIVVLQVSNLITHRPQWCSRHTMYISIILPDIND